MQPTMFEGGTMKGGGRFPSWPYDMYEIVLLYTGVIHSKLRDAFKKLLPLAADWNNIGVLLGIKDNILREIRHNEKQGYDCLREMLSEWLKIDNPPPTWNSLADAVKLFNAAIAQVYP